MIITSYGFGNMLVEAGILPSLDNVVRVVIDAPAGRPVVVHITKLCKDEETKLLVKQMSQYELRSKK